MNLYEFELKLQQFKTSVLPGLGAELRNIVARELFLEIVKASPVGAPRVDDHPGLYRASNTVSLGKPMFTSLPKSTSYMVPGAETVDNALQAAPPGLTVYEANAARQQGTKQSYAGVIEGGRTADSRGRMAGSEQAEKGVYGPSIENVQQRAVEIEEEAIAIVSSSF